MVRCGSDVLDRGPYLEDRGTGRPVVRGMRSDGSSENGDDSKASGTTHG